MSIIFFLRKRVASKLGIVIAATTGLVAFLGGAIWAAADVERVACPAVEAWSTLRESCVGDADCDGLAIHAFLEQPSKCETRTVQVAIPAIRAEAAALLAVTAPTQGTAAANWWNAAESACTSAGGLKCSRPQLERMVTGIRGAARHQ